LNLIFLTFVLFVFLLNSYLLYNRTNKWIKSSKKWLLVSILALIGLILYSYFKDTISRNTTIILKTFRIPLTFSIIDYIFSNMSFMTQNREIKLYLRGSPGTIHGDMKKRVKYSLVDKLLSFLLLIFSLFNFFLCIIV
jgi:uncharacterized membrane protein